MKTPSVEESQRVFIVWKDAKSVSLEKCYLIFSGNNPTTGKRKSSGSLHRCFFDVIIKKNIIQHYFLTNVV
jgi:hypothetical protein